MRALRASVARRSKSAVGVALIVLSACATLNSPQQVASEHMIIGPKGYTVDWGLPKTGDYWVPNDTKNDIKAASDACGALPSVFIYHHIPRRPWFSYVGLHFDPGVDEQKKACVLTRLKAVPALTVYPKRS